MEAGCTGFNTVGDAVRLVEGCFEGDWPIIDPGLFFVLLLFAVLLLDRCSSLLGDEYDLGFGGGASVNCFSSSDLGSNRFLWLVLLLSPRSVDSK